MVVPGVVPESRLAAVDQEVDDLAAADPPPADTVGKHFWFLPPGQLPASDAALRHSGALDIAVELVAPHTLDLSLDHIQIALTYPPYDHWPGGPHVDGHRPDQQRPHSFTMLAAIYSSTSRTPRPATFGLAGLASGPPAALPAARHPRSPACKRPLDDARPATGSSGAAAGLGPPRRPASRPLPSRPQHRRQYDRTRPAHCLLPARLPGSRGPVGANIPRRLRRVLASASPARGLTTRPAPSYENGGGRETETGTRYIGSTQRARHSGGSKGSAK